MKENSTLPEKKTLNKLINQYKQWLEENKKISQKSHEENTKPEKDLNEELKSNKNFFYKSEEQKRELKKSLNRLDKHLYEILAGKAGTLQPSSPTYYLGQVMAGGINSIPFTGAITSAITTNSLSSKLSEVLAQLEQSFTVSEVQAIVAICINEKEDIVKKNEEWLTAILVELEKEIKKYESQEKVIKEMKSEIASKEIELENKTQKIEQISEQNKTLIDEREKLVQEKEKLLQSNNRCQELIKEFEEKKNKEKNEIYEKELEIAIDFTKLLKKQQNISQKKEMGEEDSRIRELEQELRAEEKELSEARKKIVELPPENSPERTLSDEINNNQQLNNPINQPEKEKKSDKLYWGVFIVIIGLIFLPCLLSLTRTRKKSKKIVLIEQPQRLS
jgi:hypothetical protein